MIVISIGLGSMVEASNEFGDSDLDQGVPTFVIVVQRAVPSEKNFDLKYSLEFEGSIVKELGGCFIRDLYINPKPFDLDSFSSPFLEDTDPQLIKKMNSIIDSIKKEKALYEIIYK
jgi:hypothetical protein